MKTADKSSFELIAAAMVIISSAAASSAEVEVVINHMPEPQHVTICEGDTIIWRVAEGGQSVSLTSFEGRWSTDEIAAGESQSVTFTNAGFYAYHTSRYAQTLLPNRWRTVGSVTVNGCPDKRIVSLAAPNTNMVLRAPLSGLVARTFTAAVNLPREDVERVEFYTSDTLMGTANEWPYAIRIEEELDWGTHEVKVKVITKAGESHLSETYPIRFVAWSTPPREVFSFAHTLGGGRFMFHVVPPYGGRNELLFSEDLKEWHYLDTTTREVTMVDEASSAERHRFYSIQQANPP